jgi:hypothetical protein
VSRRRTLLKALAVAAAAVVVFVSLPLVWLRWDEAPPEDSDLTVQRPDVAEADNGFTYLVAAQAKLVRPDAAHEKLITRMVKGIEWDGDFAADVLGGNQEALALLDRAAACPVVVFPEGGVMGPQQQWKPGDWDLLIRLGYVRAEAFAVQGRHDEALAQAMRIVRLGRRIQGGYGSIIAFMTGQSAEFLGLRIIRKQLNEAEVQPEQLALYVRQMATLTDTGECLIQTVKTDYAAYLLALANLREDQGDLANTHPERLTGYARLKDRLTVFLFLCPNETKRRMAESVRVLIDDASRPRIEAQTRKPADKPSHRNFIGQSACRMIDFEGSFASGIAVFKTEAGVTEIVLALKAFKAKTSRLPVTLQELVPEYLPAVPLDDFDGRPLRYSAEKKVVYSVGTNFTDDGGMTREEAR